MATVYRDYGVLGYDSAPGNAFEVIPRRLIYLVTHGGDDSRLPFMYRSFISFAYGTRKNTQGEDERVYIEDFDLIATFVNDRMNRAGSAPFEDKISTYDMLNGLTYWNTHYKANSLEFNLSTDGIDLKKLEEFLYWFRPGEAKELVLSEHPNRAILARIADAPQLNLLPFEHDVEIKITKDTFYTKTTLYKGDITLKFVMDDPHWYSIDNILGRKQGNRYINEWRNALGQWVNIFSSQDALKIIYEDGIPLGSMIEKNMLLGNGTYASVEGQVISKIWSMTEEEENWATEGVGARIEANDATYPYEKGVIMGSIIDATGDGIRSLEPGAIGLFYYAGTAPAPTVISFTLIPEMDNNYYIVTPNNSKSSEKKYSTITIESIHKLELLFTIPNIFTSYNKALEIFETKISASNTWEDVRQSLRDEVRHPRVREWAIKVLDTMRPSNSDIIDDSNVSNLLFNAKNHMSYIFKNSSSIILPITLEFNSETGEAEGTFYYRTIDESSSVADWAAYQAETLSLHTEDVGDMLKSNYIVLVDRNFPTADGYITEWTSTNPQYSHRIYHDLNVSLSYLSILYKNMYL